LGKLDPKIRTFGIIDELFTATDPMSGEGCTSAIIPTITSAKNAITILSTHFINVCYNNLTPNIMYVKFNAVYDSDAGEYIFPYQINKGISNQHIAIEMLKEKGYDPEIINRALAYVNNIHNRSK
jgi:DNA mismatch repair ATPase MutS